MRKISPMKITPDDLTELERLYRERERIAVEKSDLINRAIENHGNDETEVTRTFDGKTETMMVPQHALWTEARTLGEGSPAWNDLHRLFPDILRLHDDEAKAVAAVRKFEMATFGFDHRDLTLPNLISLVSGLVNMATGDRGKTRKK